MSKELKSINGTFKSESTNQMRGIELSLTSFWGGKEGEKLALNISNFDQNNNFSHITLNKEQIKELIKELQNNFNL
tara:strand:+ start:309 stop:536 length:228 start_codon:yes stop_codon:yes gene_type:complete